jgi:foldase protein PrsA
LAAFAAIGCQGGGGAGGGGDVATVNGDRITKAQFTQYLMVKPTVQVAPNSPGVNQAVVVNSLGLQALQDLVRQQLLMQMARDENLFPNEAEIQQELTFRTKQDPAFVRNLTGRGLSLDMIRRDLSIQLAQYRLLTRGITISDAEVDEYIKANPNRWTTPELAELRWIVVSNANRRQEAERKLQAGEAFTTVAGQYSEIQGARENQGKMVIPNNPFREGVPLTALDNIQPGLTAKVRSTAEGRQTAWIQSGNQFAKFLIEKKSPASKREVKPEDREEIKRQLATNKGAEGIDMDERIRQRLIDAKIEVSENTLKEPWKQYMERVKAEKPATAGTATN